MAEGPLQGWRLAQVPVDPAANCAAELLQALGAGRTGPGPALLIPAAPGSGAAADWAASGAMSLTGSPDGPAQQAPGRPATAARAAVLAMQALGLPAGLLGHQLLGERAALRGLPRNAPWSVGGSCRAVQTRDGWLAVSLARQDDLDAVPALVCSEGSQEPWAQLEAWARTRTSRQAAERAQLLGIPAAPVPATPVPVWPPWQIDSAVGHPSPPRPRVLDLSTLWAGPLCGNLLGLAGADVVRVESTGRPDGGRRSPAFDDLLHAGQPSVALPFDTHQGRSALHRLVAGADVVLTSARSRALRALGLEPASYLADRASGVWVSITAHPAKDGGSEWVGFGDDAAMAAGLVHGDGQGRPVPCGDAVADPLTGVHAALAALACLRAGGRHHVRLNLRDVAASTLVSAAGQVTAGLAQPARARRALGTARPLGADTDAVLAAG